MPKFDKDELISKFSEATPFQEIVRYYEDLGKQKHLVLCQVRVNGQVVGDESDGELAGLVLQGIQDLELEFVNRGDLFQGASESLIDHLSSIILFSTQTGEQIASSNPSGKQRIDHLLVSLKGVSSTLVDFKRTLISEGAVCDGCGLWSTAESSLKTLVQALVLAAEINDFVLLSSLLEYDLPEALKEWQDLLRDGKQGLLQLHENQPNA